MDSLLGFICLLAIIVGIPVFILMGRSGTKDLRKAGKASQVYPVTMNVSMSTLSDSRRSCQVILGSDYLSVTDRDMGIRQIHAACIAAGSPKNQKMLSFR